MAFPFGGHPTFAQYLAWAVERGCKIQSGVDTEQSISLTKITAPSEKWAIVAGVLPTEILLPTTIGSLDRRLGLISPWFGLPLDS
jgi:hypothetical protein